MLIGGKILAEDTEGVSSRRQILRRSSQEYSMRTEYILYSEQCMQEVILWDRSQILRRDSQIRRRYTKNILSVAFRRLFMRYTSGRWERKTKRCRAGRTMSLSCQIRRSQQILRRDTERHWGCRWWKIVPNYLRYSRKKTIAGVSKIGRDTETQRHTLSQALWGL